MRLVICILAIVCAFDVNAQPVQANFKIIGNGDIRSYAGPSMGSAWGDYNNDGFEDLYVCNYSHNISFLFRNNGDSTFTSIQDLDVINGGESSSAATWGDYDNDGFIDLFVVNDFGKNVLYHNNNGVSFTRIDTGEIVTDSLAGWDASWVDYNNDGYLDIFVATNNQNCLYKNNGDGSFSKIQASNIVTDNYASFSCAWGDYNNDGFPDLFTANYGNQNNCLYRNKGDGTFARILSGNIVNDGGQSRSASWGDYNNDGFLDLFVTNSGQPNFLYKNNGDGTFTKITNDPLVLDNKWSFSCTWNDFNNDGYLDMFVVNSTSTDTVSLFLNNKNGTFVKIKDQSLFADQSSSWTISSCDYNKNGFVDLFVGSRGFNKSYLFTNKGNGNHYIGIKLKGVTSNQSAIGARIKVKSNDMWQTRYVSANTGHASQNSLSQLVGTGSDTEADTILIYWPSGITQTIVNKPANKYYSFTECTPRKVDISYSICQGDSFYFNGLQIKNQGTYTDTLLSVNGCDSVITLALKVNPTYAEYDTAMICKGDNYQLGDQTLTHAGNYQYTFKSKSGCDSIVYLRLNINAIDTTVIRDGNVLTATINDATYEWITCANDGIQLENNTGSSYTVPSNGSYSVIITKNGCADTSGCHEILFSQLNPGIISLETVYPNPSNGIFNIDPEKPFACISLVITDISGHIIITKSFFNNESIDVDMRDFPDGIYILTLNNGRYLKNLRLIKK